MPRMVKTPWSEEEIPFETAAEIGTKKVIEEHSTIGILVTTDGSITDIPREDYIKAEERVVSELKALRKPFIILLNSETPSSSYTQELANTLSEKYETPVIPTNCEDLTIDEKIKETKDRLERIFATSLLPNQGKKIIVTYNGDKKTIPRKYQGYFNETMKELRLLEKNKTNNLTSPSQTNEPQLVAKPIIQYTVDPKTLSSGITSSPQLLTGAVGNENIYQDIFNYKKYTPKEFASSEDQKLFEELFKKCPEEKKEEIYDKLFSKEAIARRNQLVSSLTKQIELEPTFRQTVTIAKSYITTVSKKLVDKVKSIGLNIKNKSEKIKEQASDIKYEVINRTIRFKENTCQKVNETKNKICDISKENARNLQFAFAEIKEEMQKRQEKRKYTKDDLFEIIANLQEENRLKKREINLYKARIKVLEQNSRGGYVATSIITIIGILILSGTIFTIIGRLLNH